MIRTSPPTILIFKKLRPLKRAAGYSLIEILIVVGLIALIMSIAVPNFGAALKINLNNSSRELATTIRTAYDESVLKGTIYRVAFDLDKREYWVEAGERGFLLQTADQVEEQERRNRKKKKEEIEKDLPIFQLAQSVTKKKISLPTGVKFTDIINSRSKEPVKNGIMYAHIFPHGFIEKCIIHLEDNYQRQSTLVVNSVNGKSRLFERYYAEDSSGKERSSR